MENEYLTREEEEELQRLIQWNDKKPEEITDSERNRMIELLTRDRDEDAKLRESMQITGPDKKKGKKKKEKKASSDPSKDIEELRTLIMEYVQNLHAGISDRNSEWWYESIQRLQRKYPDFSSTNFCSAIAEIALKEILTENPNLSKAKQLKTYLKSKKGKIDLVKRIHGLMQSTDPEERKKIMIKAINMKPKKE